MKKMVCEICGSQSIKKENGVFVCQECGTEYSLEDAKGLLKDVDTISQNESSVKTIDKNYLIDVDSLKEQLLLWANVTYFFDSIRNSIFNINSSDKSFWNKDSVLSLKAIPNGTFYGATCKNWSLAEGIIDKDKPIYGTLEDVKNVAQKLLDEAEKVVKDSAPTSSAKRYYGEVIPKYKEVIEWAENVSKIDIELSQNHWKEEVQQLINSKFCFEEIKALTNSNDKIEYYLLNNTRRKEYIDLSKPDPKNYYEYLSRVFRRYKTGDRPYEFKIGLFRSKRIYYYTNFDFDALHKKISNKFNEIESRHNKLFNDVVVKHIEDCRSLVLKYLETAFELERVFFLPYEYRKTETIINMIDMLESGKASNWKELANLFDTNLYREKMLSSLEQINNRLSSIENTLRQTNLLLRETNSHLKQLDDKMKDLNHSARVLINKTEKIKKYSFITMFETLDA